MPHLKVKFSLFTIMWRKNHIRFEVHKYINFVYIESRKLEQKYLNVQHFVSLLKKTGMLEM